MGRGGDRFRVDVPLHPLDDFDAEQVQAALDRAGRQVAQQQPAGAQLVGFGLQHGAVFEEVAVAAGQLEQVGREVVRPVVGDDAVERFGELQQRDAPGRARVACRAEW